METRKRKKRATKAEIQAQRLDDWGRLRRVGHAGLYVCQWCGESKYCRGTTKRRMACKECYVTKGPPVIKRDNVEAATLSVGNQSGGGET